MLFVQRQPAAPLDASVESIWFCRNTFARHVLQRVLPTGGPQLIINLSEDKTRTYESTNDGLQCTTSSGTTITGLTTRSQIIDTAEQEYVAGVSFRPGGTLPFFSTRATELANADVPVDVFWGRAGVALLRERLLAAPSPDCALNILEASLLLAWRNRPAHPAVTFALTAFRANPSLVRIQQVRDAIGLSPKRFIERFKSDVGLTPKQFCRLLRFQRAVNCAHQREVDWTRLALGCGYFDQAHFIHEFREFSGLTPGGYQAASTEFQSHVNFLQSSAFKIT